MKSVKNNNRKEPSPAGTENYTWGELAKELELASLIFDHLNLGMSVIDAEGYVAVFNKFLARFLGLDTEATISRHVSEVFPNTTIQNVAKTGIPELNLVRHIRGHDVVVQRIPIFKNGRVIGIYGEMTYTDVKDIRLLESKLKWLESKVKKYEEKLSSMYPTRYTFDAIYGSSPILLELKKKARKAAALDAPVLITGESGSGKEMFAQAIHHAGQRRTAPFIRINCAAIPRELFESELFGYDKGAFTGALSQGKPGKFELANKGTIFLDEIGELPLEMQPKLLRVLEERELERIGGNRPIKTDFRLICATNQNLDDMLAQKRFREDLFYRINVIHLQIPSLRERREDIIPIACQLLEKITENGHAAKVEISPLAKKILLKHDWPGNARELHNALNRALSTMDGDIIEPWDLPLPLSNRPGRLGEGDTPVLKKAVDRVEKEALQQALAATNNNKAKAAKMLGIHRTILYKKMKKYGL